MKFSLYPIIYYGQFFLQKVLSKVSQKYRINLVAFFEFMEDKDYVIVKLDSPKIHHNFPDEYIIGTDVDIIVLDKDLGRIKSVILDLNENKKLQCQVIDSNKNVKIRYELGGFLNFQFDLSANTTSKLFNDCLFYKDSMKNLNVPNIKYELLLRAKELDSKSYKKHHLKYLIKHKNQIDFDFLTDNGVNSDTLQKIKNS
ncbi:MAG: hypothetical protein AB8B52_10550 [Winogradskyella sp.]|uniref:hypothetical protein n=1 Tax=Winogradskyella sp. TaxID=1883156 RepID=UPI0038590B7D